MKGLIFDIQRFCVHDGPGIRTVVFLKGCPLRCAWCHNPESQRRQPELFFSPHLCIGCDSCAPPCPHGSARRFLAARGEETSLEALEACAECMACAGVCPSGAIEAAGEWRPVEGVMAEVAKDRIFYEESGGGLTLSGGEPMAQYDFVQALLEAARTAGLHTCIETCGYGRREDYLALLPLVDLWLWDVKDTNPARHREFTGGDLERILGNLHAVDDAGGTIRLRCPMIPEVNMTSEHLARLRTFVDSLQHAQGIELMPFHPLGGGKTERLGRPDAAAGFCAPTADEMAWAETLLAGAARARCS